jgi:general stress protein 26
VSVAFSDIADDYLRIVTQTAYCVATTVDSRGRPRGRVLNPVFVVDDGRPRGWALTGRTPLKSRHLAANPHVSCAFWSPTQDTVFADCVASWVEDDGEKEQVWELFAREPPLGWGPEGVAGWGGDRWRSPIFTPLRFEPWRVQVMRGEEYPYGRLTGRVWRSDG